MYESKIIKQLPCLTCLVKALCCTQQETGHLFIENECDKFIAWQRKACDLYLGLSEEERRERRKYEENYLKENFWR